MNDENNGNGKGMSRRELVALGCSAVIVITGIVYWGIQIDGVMEMLEMAYG